MYKLDLFNNKFVIQRFVVVQIVMVLALILVGYRWATTFTEIVEQNIAMNIIIGLVGFAVTIVLHELIHSALFRMFSGGKRPIYTYRHGVFVTYVPKMYYKKWQFFTIMLAPLIIITLASRALFTVMPYSSLIFIASIHLGYCLLDLYLVGIVLNHKYIKYIEDTQDGIILYPTRPAQTHVEVE